MKLARTSHLAVALKLVFTRFLPGLYCLLLFASPVRGQTVIFSESFDLWTNINGCPQGWACSTQPGCASGNACYWGRQDGFGPIGQPSFFGCNNSSNYARCNTENLIAGVVPAMITPTIDLSGYPLSDSIKLSFCYINSSATAFDGDGIIISFSADSGVTWGLQFIDLASVYNHWTNLTLTVPSFYKTAQFRIKIEGVGNGNTGDIGIDELELVHQTISCSSLAATAIISSDYNGFPISCFGAADASVKAVAIGGLAPYTYAWSNGQTTNEATGLSSGVTSVIITDANGCQATASVLVQEPELLTLSLVKPPSTHGFDISCFGQASGSATAVVNGGVGPFSYNWNDGQNTATASQLSAGSHTVVVTDGNGCNQQSTISLTAPPQLSTTVAAVESYNGFAISCAGKEDGAAKAEVSGGIAPYHYQWSNGEDTEQAVKLNGGIHTVSITDAGNCQDSASVQLAEPAPLSLGLLANDANCANTADGSIFSDINGGVAPYSYKWSGGQDIQNLNFVVAGEYRLVVTDANGCVISESATVSAPPAMEVSSTTGNPSCFGQADGFIDLDISGGEAPYSVVWNNGATEANVTELIAGRYAATITDASGCEVLLGVSLDEPGELDVQVITVSDDGSSEGSIELLVKGGEAPYLYAWSHTAEETDSKADSLPAGQYEVVVIDANGCEVEQKVEVESVRELNCLQIHTGFSPNGDGVNETWTIPCLPLYADNQLIILNRWGQQLLQVDRYQNEWDGRLNGSPLPDGTYYYILKVNSPTDKRVFRGTVTIIR